MPTRHLCHSNAALANFPKRGEIFVKACGDVGFGRAGAQMTAADD